MRKTLNKIILLLCLSLLTIQTAPAATASEAPLLQGPMPAEIRTSYEEVPFGPGKEMGLAGVHFDIHPFQDFRPFYAGLGMFGTLTGDEGGFFALGYTLGIKCPLIEGIYADAGFFMGGGGGSSSTFPGSGTLLRTHLVLEKRFGTFGIRAGAARTDFPDSDNQAFESDYHFIAGLSLEHDLWESLSAKAPSATASEFAGELHKFRVTPAALYYEVDSKPMRWVDRNKNAKVQQDNFPLLGLQIEREIGHHFSGIVEAYGAGENAVGYASILAGVGYELPLATALSWELKALAGMGGDGSIDVGGGLILQPMAGLRLKLTDALSVRPMIGRVIAPDGNFAATSYELGLSWQQSRPTPGSGPALFAPQKFNSIPWSFTAANKTYLPRGDGRKTTGQAYDSPLDLVGIELAAPVTPWLSFVGSTWWAWGGNVGSYAEGLFGVRLTAGAEADWAVQPTLTYEVGVGGGGHIDLGNGFIHQGLIGAEIPTPWGFSLAPAGGRMQTHSGSFKADVLTLGLKWNQNSLFAK